MNQATGAFRFVLLGKIDAKTPGQCLKRIRNKQADVPISIVCHSRDNMIGLGAAFCAAQFCGVSAVSGEIRG